MCSLLPLANTISPWLDSPLPPLSPPHSTLGATSSANQPSNDACFPTIQTTKKAIQGVGGFSVSRCHQRKGWLSRTKPSHLPSPSLHLPGSPFQLPTAGLYAKPLLHQPFNPLSPISENTLSSSQISPARLLPTAQSTPHPHNKPHLVRHFRALSSYFSLGPGSYPRQNHKAGLI